MINDSRGYFDLLERNLWLVIVKHFPDKDYLFQDNRASIHTAHIIRNYKQNHAVKTPVRPPISSDLNPIDNLWSILNARITVRINEINLICGE